MKKAIFTVMLALMAIGLQAQQSTVQCTLKGMKDGGNTVIVSRVDGSNVLVVDTLTTDADGVFIFRTEMAKPTLFLLSYPGHDGLVTHVMLKPGEHVTLALDYDEAANFMEVTAAKGSRDAKLYQSFNQQLAGFTRAAQQLDKEFAQADNNRKRELNGQFQQLQTTQKVAVRKLIEQNTDVLMSAFLVTYFDSDVETYIDLFEAVERGLAKDYGDNQFVQYVSGKVKSSLTPGRMAPEIAMKDPDGKERKLSDLRGKVVMIDFWASWCRPCRMENPNVVRMYKKYHDKGFEIYSVSLDKNLSDWTRAIAQDGLEWDNHVSDLNGWTSSGGAAYGITSVPSTVLVDRQGRIIARNLRGGQLEAKLKEIFGE